MALNVYTSGESTAERQAKFSALIADRQCVAGLLQLAETLRLGLPLVFEKHRLQLAEAATIEVVI
jgi:hypothetical protein